MCNATPLLPALTLSLSRLAQVATRRGGNGNGSRGGVRVDAFFKGMFGGGQTATQDADGASVPSSQDPPPTPQVATGEKTRVEVTLGRPMGLVLEPLDGRDSHQVPVLLNFQLKSSTFEVSSGIT